LDGLDP